MGWRHFLSAKAWSCACNWPRAGGAAKSDPITLKRKCAQRSLDRKGGSSFFIGCQFVRFFATSLVTVCFYRPTSVRSPGILCGWLIIPQSSCGTGTQAVVNGRRNRSKSSSRSKRVI